MSQIQDEIKRITASLPCGVRLVAVSKYHPESHIEEAYAAGQRVFGESHVQELRRKYDNLPKDIEWHFIGHLQTNKVKYIAPYVAMIHAVDSMKLLLEIDKQGEKSGRVKFEANNIYIPIIKSYTIHYYIYGYHHHSRQAPY